MGEILPIPCFMLGHFSAGFTLDTSAHVTTSAQNEDILRGTMWRSDGTVDQLYLSLRLAVANALTPNAPLVLDDALVRFDDKRLLSALSLLQEQAETRQVILFSCQHSLLS